MNQRHRLVDATTAAERLGVKPATLYSYVSRGLLHSRRDTGGRHSLFDPVEIDALITRGSRRRPEPGEIAIESVLTSLGADRPYYRGRDALDLARTASYEEVAEWLWTGAADDRPEPWTALADAVASATAAQAALPPSALPIDRLQVIVTALGVSDPLRFNLDPDATSATARSLIAGMVDALPSVGRPAPAGAPIARRLWHKLSAQAPKPALLRALDGALVLLADHELAASTTAVRVAASVHADPYAVVTSGLGVLTGPMHGGASLGVERMLAETRAPGHAAAVIDERLRRGERVPGVGHTIYKSGDGRADVLFGLLRAAAPKHDRLAVADALLAEMHRRRLPQPNVDFAVATLSAVAGMPPGSGQVIFAVARTAGWLAHAMEEYAGRRPLRPRAVYTGPPISR